VAPFGIGLVFFNVLFEQLGLPLPALPTLIVAGALAADGRLPVAGLYAFALAACAIGDGAWYVAGRLYGAAVMRLLCRISLTPDICVSQTQSSFERWGSGALVVAKFVPGLSMIAPPLAGATRMNYLRFGSLSVLGSALWVGLALVAGALLRPQIVRLLPRLSGVGGAAVALLLVLFGIYVAFKWWQRRRFFSALEMARISVADLHAQIADGKPPVIVDVRSPTAQSIELRRIPGALHVPLHDVELHMGELPRDSEIVLYCNCPNEASAAQAARVLLNHGFHRVRPLGGGLDAWIAAGFAVEEVVVAAPLGAADVAGPADVTPAQVVSAAEVVSLGDAVSAAGTVSAAGVATAAASAAGAARTATTGASDINPT
jgi:membrane protein DedA with SNARE-associated domain/rhodanese-related sulfurtransferase